VFTAEEIQLSRIAQSTSPANPFFAVGAWHSGVHVTPLGYRPEVLSADAHRTWDEGVCAVHGLTAVLPLWGESTRTLVEGFIASGSTALIVTAPAYLDSTWLGRSIWRRLKNAKAAASIRAASLANTTHLSGALRFSICR
jgi:hypothetical protein